MSSGPSTGSNGSNGSSGSAASVGRRLLGSRVFWSCWGVAMAVAGLRIVPGPWPLGSNKIVAFVVLAAFAAVLAPPQLRRPLLLTSRWVHRVDMHRNTLLSVGFVLLVATEKATALEAGVDAALLGGYLLLLDAATMPSRVLRRLANPLFLLVLVATAAGSAALLALPAQTSVYPRIAAAAVALFVVAAAVATAFTASFSRRVGSSRPESPESDHTR
jgi:hypothetical protein